MNIPVFVWEGNGFAGLTNQIMKKRAKRIYCGFDGMDKQFPHGNWIHSGNPIRKELLSPVDPDKCYKFFGLSPEKPIIFITGGSLGAQSINQAIENSLEDLISKGYQIIWQTGKHYQKQFKHEGLWQEPFLNDMRLAYSIAHLVISRSGALSVSEIMAMGVPAILIPSPNVTDDHQTKNAEKATVNNGAVLIPDKHLDSELITRINEILESPERQKSMKIALLAIAKPEATKHIVDDIIKQL